MNLLSLANEMETMFGCSPQCESCIRSNQSTKATILCETCDVYMCLECSRMHRRVTFHITRILKPLENATMSEHVESIPAEIAPKSSARVDLQSIDRCSEHGKKLKYVCQDDNKLCCSQCVIMEHKKYEYVIELNAAVKNNKDAISQMQKIIDNNTSTMHYLKYTERVLLKQSEDLPKALDDMHRQLNEWFDEGRLDALKMANDETKKKMSQLQQRHMKCESFKESLSEALKLCTDTEQHGTTVQQFIVQQNLKEQLDGYQKTALELSSSIETLRIIRKFADPIDNLLKSREKIVLVEVQHMEDSMHQ